MVYYTASSNPGLVSGKPSTYVYLHKFILFEAHVPQMSDCPILAADLGLECLYMCSDSRPGWECEAQSLQRIAAPQPCSTGIMNEGIRPEIRSLVMLELTFIPLSASLLTVCLKQFCSCTACLDLYFSSDTSQPIPFSNWPCWDCIHHLIDWFIVPITAISITKFRSSIEGAWHR